ncbi:T-cell activation Rho GTPase-activating protein-like protein [Amazona aestiva]|uniref:T-cell activation Rho GTPase-activating protein-like protein n=1 Tax=Amazona aestiva TaxID=12930 RepID=A0A0Q3X733_AMAAE|nr:T-cell activation Rho GTPase-activating protein-like protein [Amazona aestiva]
MGQWLCCCRSRDDPGPDQRWEPNLASPELLLREHMRVTQGHGQRKMRDLLLFKDSAVIAKTKPQEGVQGARVTQLPSIKLVLKELSGRHAGMTLDASSLEKLLQHQAQDLLRKIPSKLLNVQLYEEWMSTMEKTSRQERLQALREVASKLPEASLLLLWHLLSLLSSISRNVATTKMSAGNLAICMAPNLLSPPHELPLDVLAQEIGKVTQLLEFVIDHQEELLGEQEARLAREGDEETPAPQAEASEVHKQCDNKSLPSQKVPPVAPKSEQQRSFSGNKRFPGSSHVTRKRRATWEESSNGPLCLKTSKTKLSGMGN